MNPSGFYVDPKIPQIVTLIRFIELGILSYLEGLQTKKAVFR